MTVLAAGTVAAVLGALLAAGGGGDAHGNPAARPLPHPSQGRCPAARLEKLPGDALAGATHAALDQAPAIYKGTDVKGMRATKASIARADDDPGRGGYARVKCGRRVQARTVVVYLEFPAMRPSASMSQGVVLVSRVSGAYHVWAQLH